MVTQGITPLSIYEGAYNGKPNPHAWMSAQNALIYIENIRAAFVKYDPKNESIYNKNAKAYGKRVISLHKRLKKELAFIPPDKRYLATSEGAFSYMTKELGMQEIYLWPMNADQQGTPQQVRKMIDSVRKIPYPCGI